MNKEKSQEAKHSNEPGGNPETYHGWKNYETWAVYTHVTSDPVLSQHWTNIAKEYGIHDAAETLRDSIISIRDAITKIPGIRKQTLMMVADLIRYDKVRYIDVIKALLE